MSHICSCCPLSCHWASLRRAIFFTHSHHTHWWDPLKISLLQGEQLQFSCPSRQVLQDHNHLHGPSMELLQDVHISLVLGSPALQVCLTRARQGWRITSLDLLAMLCLMQPRRLLAAFAARAHCRLLVNLVSTGIPRYFSTKLLSSSSAPICTGTLSYSFPHIGLPLVALFSNPSRSLWMKHYHLVYPPLISVMMKLTSLWLPISFLPMSSFLTHANPHHLSLVSCTLG